MLILLLFIMVPVDYWSWRCLSLTVMILYSSSIFRFMRSTRRFSDVLCTAMNVDNQQYVSSLHPQRDAELDGRMEKRPRFRIDTQKQQEAWKVVREWSSEREAAAMASRERAAEWTLYHSARATKHTRSGHHRSLVSYPPAETRCDKRLENDGTKPQIQSFVGSCRLSFFWRGDSMGNSEPSSDLELPNSPNEEESSS